MSRPLPAPADWCPPRSLRYRRPAVRDLAWLVLDGALPLSPQAPVLEGVSLDAAEQAEFMQLLQRWDEDPDDAWLEPVDPRLRLGLYAELLLGAWLRRSQRIRLLARNWPLRPARITLGEADFLVRREGAGDAGLQLWELACKFYLCVPGCGWLGPELKDSLALKLERMRSHQLRLIEHDGFRAAWPGSWSARAWLSGWLLDPAASLLQGAPPAGRGQSSRIPSVWAESAGESLAIAEAQAQRLGVTGWWLLPKRRWLRPVFADEPPADRFESLAHAAAVLRAPPGGAEAAAIGMRPMMLAGIRLLSAPVPAGPSAESVHAEAMRVMLVPPGWTARAARGR